ncbi:tripartite tricarboxylate transporter TctB family protein [Microbacterium sp. G2-8]|uniref:tripartite tricarboxylate transporter TctB family protein n=1 Tax=Microbacterium sp. G2-8 TaxID=2842454 RepID=UPI001C88F7E2|nr:tripartite tricarboxylate transporter TctB family protein [Microbacterium sp. G2-8]
MSGSNNPTAVSAVVGERLEFGSRSGRGSALAVALLMPVLLVAFATYLAVGIATMQIPPGTAFPGPRFFPAIIMTGLYAFAAMLVVSAVRGWRAPAPASDSPDDDAPTDGTSTLVTRRVGMDWRSFAWIVGSVLGFTLSLQILGWIVGAGLLFWCVARGFGSPRPLFSLIVGFAMSSATYIAFDMALGLSLPSGILGGGF